MKILMADSLGSAATDTLRNSGFVVSEFNNESETLAHAVVGHDALIVRSTKVDAEVLAAGSQLGLVVRAGAGTDTIDTAAAANRGIFVCNVPGRNAIAVAELAMGLLMSIDRSIVDGAVDLRNGVWDKTRYKSATGLAGRTAAIIGLGSIGLEFAKRASAFDMRVIAERRDGRTPDTERQIRQLGIRLVDDRSSLLAQADIVSLHVPGGPTTTNMVNAEFLSKLKPGAVLINTSRGSTIDEHALLARLERGDLHVGLDVFPDEPSAGQATFVSALAQHPMVVGSHHIGASTEQAADAVVDGVVEVISGFRTGSLLNCVNLQDAPTRSASLIIRHIDQVGVLAEVLQVLRASQVNVQEMTNRVFEGASAAVATIHVATEPPAAAIEAIETIEPVVGVQVQVHA